MPIYNWNKVVDHAYRLYQLDWLKSHGYSLLDLFHKIRTNIADDPFGNACPSVIAFENAVYEFEEEGFSGELWACREEFEECEMQDKLYITNLLSSDKDMLTSYLIGREALLETERCKI